MSPWRWRLAARRSRVEAGLLGVVLLVSSLAATLMGTLYLLDHATATTGARAELAATPSTERELRFTIRPVAASPAILQASDSAAATILGDLPAIRTADVIGAHRVIPLEDDGSVVGFVAESAQMMDAVALRDGRWPSRANAASIEVAIPDVMARDLDLKVGETFELTESTSETVGLTATVCGIYVPDARAVFAWRADPLDAAGYAGALTVPGGYGSVTAPGYGPLLAAEGAADLTGVATVDVSYLPQIDGLSVDALAELEQRLDKAPETIARQLGTDAQRVDTEAPLAATAGRITSSAAMTRSSLLVTALLLVTLSAVALVQTARLVSDRRETERHLLAARGASASQLFALGLLEALLVGGLTVLAGVFGSQGLYRILASGQDMARAGLDRDPGIPPGVWAATSVVGLVLVVVLISGLVRRPGVFAHSEAARARPGRRAAFQRSGLDLGVVALAALAVWQLRLYQSPLVGQGARVDVLLSASPALALLAGGLAAARLIPLVARGLEALAGAGRGATGALAAWEVGRRPSKATAAILLLSLAVSIGTFAMTFNSTWKTSQSDQALFAHPQDAVAQGTDVAWFDQREALEARPGDAPVIRGASEISNQEPASLWLGNESFRGTPATLLATTTDGWRVFDQGRLDEVRGYTLARELTDTAVPDPRTTGLDLGAGVDSIGARIGATMSLTSVTDVLIGARVLVTNSSGDMQSIDLGYFLTDGMTHEVRGYLPSPSDDLHIMGVQFTMASTGQAEVSQRDNDAREATITVTIEAIGPASSPPGWSLANVEPPGVLLGVDSTRATTWAKTSTGGIVNTVYQEADATILTFDTSLSALRSKAVSTALTAAPQVGSVPVVTNSGLLASVKAKVGEDGALRVGTTTVKAHLAATVASVPGIATDVTAVPLTSLQLAVFQAGGSTPQVTAWWLSGDDAAARAAQLDPQATSREALHRAYATAPLRVAIPTAIVVVVLASTILAAFGFAIHVTVSTRARAVELAHVAAIGMRRSQLTATLAIENTLLALLGSAVGLGLGVAVAGLVGPLVAYGPEGGRPVPDAIVVIPWVQIAALVIEVIAVLATAIALAAGLIKRIDIAATMRRANVT